eukprot:scaffold1934_cov79-Cylindrotheca_fusiformis.AAC.10
MWTNLSVSILALLVLLSCMTEISAGKRHCSSSDCRHPHRAWSQPYTSPQLFDVREVLLRSPAFVASVEKRSRSTTTTGSNSRRKQQEMTCNAAVSRNNNRKNTGWIRRSNTFRKQQ